MLPRPINLALTVSCNSRECKDCLVPRGSYSGNSHPLRVSEKRPTEPGSAGQRYPKTHGTKWAVMGRCRAEFAKEPRNSVSQIGLSVGTYDTIGEDGPEEATSGSGSHFQSGGLKGVPTANSDARPITRCFSLVPFVVI